MHDLISFLLHFVNCLHTLKNDQIESVDRGTEGGDLEVGSICRDMSAMASL